SRERRGSRSRHAPGAHEKTRHLSRAREPPDRAVNVANAQRAIDFEKESEILPRDLPPASVRVFAWTIIAVAAAAVLISVLVPFPEMIEAPFVLVPKGGADPVKAPIGGTIERVDASDGKEVKTGDVLFVISSQDLTVMDARVKNLERDLNAQQPVSD